MSEPTSVGASADMAVEFEVISPTPLSVNPLTDVGVLLHRKYSSAPDVGGPNTIMISDWNDRHVFGGGVNGQVLVRDSAAPDGASWQVPVSGDASALASYLLMSPDESLPNAEVFTVAPHFNFTDGLLSLEDNSIGNLKLRDSVGLSVIGRTEDYAGDPADIIAGTDGHVLRRAGAALAFGALDLANPTTFTGILPASKIDPAFEGTPGPAGPEGPQGDPGPAGATGATGPGVAAGGTTGQILAKSSGVDYATTWIDAPTGGGASDVLWTGPSAPTDPTTELWADTDEEPAIVSTSATWPPIPFVPPDVSAWTWVNQGGASVLTHPKVAQMIVPASGGDNMHMLVTPTPTPPYTITAALALLLYPGNNFMKLGIGWYRTANTKLWGLVLQTNPLVLSDDLWNNPNPGGLQAQITQNNWTFTPTFPFMYFRLRHDGTTLYSGFSIDGVHYQDIRSDSAASGFLGGAPDRVGLVGYNSYSGGNGRISLLSWKVESP